VLVIARAGALASREDLAVPLIRAQVTGVDPLAIAQLPVDALGGVVSVAVEMAPGLRGLPGARDLLGVGALSPLLALDRCTPPHVRRPGARAARAAKRAARP